MMRRTSALLIMLAMVLMAFALGCGAGGAPTSPPDPPDLSAEATGGGGTGNVLWGLYEVIIDPATGQVEILPLRQAEFNCNVVKFMQPPSSPTNLVSISVQPGTDWPSGYAVLDITFQHPFTGHEKLRGFDVRGILMAEASQMSRLDASLICPALAETRLLNADGYTRWWNQVEFTSFGKILGYTEGWLAVHGFDSNSTLNGYKYFADELGPEDTLDVLTGAARGSFGVTPGVNTRRYEIQFAMMPGGPTFRFKYAIDASWALPSDDWEPDYPVEAFPLSANCREAYQIKLTDTGSTAWYVHDADYGGYLKLDIEVFDWQAPYNPSGVPGELAGLWLEGEVVSTPVDLLPGATVLPGSETSSVFAVEIHRLDLTHDGLNDVFVIAHSADPSNYEPQIEGDTSRWDWPDSRLGAYLRTTVDIAGTQPQQAPIVLAIDPNEGNVDEVVPATVTGQRFEDGCRVELRESGGVFVIEADGEFWVDDTEVICTLDLTGAPLGLYDVVVINPSLLEGSLDEGFEVKESGPDDVIYVDDSNDTGVEDGTMEHPFDTIQEGLTAATLAGYEVWVDDSGNEYDGPVALVMFVRLRSVNWDATDGDDEATIYFDGTSPVVSGADLATVDGFEITGGKRTGIEIDGVSTTISNCRVVSIASWSASPSLAGIRVSNSPDTVIESCEVSGIHILGSYSPCYGIHLSNSPATVTDTEVHDVTKLGNYEAMAGIYATGCDPHGDMSLDISHCIVHHVKRDEPTVDDPFPGSYTPTHGLFIRDSSEVRLFNNIVHSIIGGNYENVYGVRLAGSDDCELVNNVIYDVRKTIFYGTGYGLYFSGCTDLDVRNTIINRIRRSGGFQSAYGVVGNSSTYTFEYNDVYDCSSALYSGVTPGTGCISADPLFVDPGNDFHLASGSPCIDTGDPAINDPDSSRSDMGAYGGPGGDW